MKDEQYAELARDQHSEFLRKKGAHAVSVDEVPVAGRKQFAVVAMVDSKGKAKDFPSKLTVKTDNREVDVPLVVQEQERFRPE